MDDLKPVHVRQAVNDFHQLNQSNKIWLKTSSGRAEVITAHKIKSVHLRLFLTLEIIVDVPLIHPLGDQKKLGVTQCPTKEWGDVRMAKVFPSHYFFAKPLYPNQKFH